MPLGGLLPYEDEEGPVALPLGEEDEPYLDAYGDLDGLSLKPGGLNGVPQTEPDFPEMMGVQRQPGMPKKGMSRLPLDAAAALMRGMRG